MSNEVRDAYSRRADEYSKQLGSMNAVHPADRQLVAEWADRVTGPVIDAGCGPGHWTHYLAGRGLDVRGIDLVPEFVSRARENYPGIAFHIGDVAALDAETATVGGVLAWYSLIHCSPSAIAVPLEEFARVLEPGGELLISFFEGPTVEKFDHAVVPAYRWPVDDLGSELQAAGFEVIETRTRTGRGYRPHGAIVARRAGASPAFP